MTESDLGEDESQQLPMTETERVTKKPQHVTSSISDISFPNSHNDLTAYGSLTSRLTPREHWRDDIVFTELDDT